MPTDRSIGRLVIFGAGGSGREIAWLARSVFPDAALDFVIDRAEYDTGPVEGISVRLLSDLPSTPLPYVVALGDPAARRRASQACDAAGLHAATLVHPAVDLTGRNTLGPGTVVCAGAVLTTGISLGCHVHVNLASTISHDAVIGDFTTLSPGVVIAGNVVIGAGVFLGAGAIVINGAAGAPLVIGDGAVVAAGACVTRAVEPGAMVAGVPAIRKK